MFFKPKSKVNSTPLATWRRIAKTGVRIDYAPVLVEEIASAEQILQFTFPRSYVDLVTALGAPRLATFPPGGARRVENYPYAVLTPVEVVEFTRRHRRVSKTMLEDENSYARVCAQLQRIIVFQLQCDASNVFVWLETQKGEPRVADLAHDYLEELDWSENGASWNSFAASMVFVEQQIQENLRDYGGSSPAVRA
jgi:hypothetical protein